MIVVNQLTKSFDGAPALRGLDMCVPRGVIYGLAGPNGAGKTTLINHLSGAYRQDGGAILIDGEPVYENTALKRQIVTIPDEWYYFGSATMRDMAAFYRGIYPSFDKERYKQLGELFEIGEGKHIRSLSKGMKKQAAFRVALSCMPELLLLDEPLDGLDPLMRHRLLEIVKADVKERGMTVLVSSHNLRELEDICTYVGIMDKGRMITEQPLDKLKAAYPEMSLEDVFITILEGKDGEQSE